MLCTSEDLPDNAIGAAVYINDKGDVQHAGIFIRHKGENKLFHYTGVQVKIDSFDGRRLYIYKGLENFIPPITNSIMMHFEVIQKEAKPEYGYFYVGSMYNESGDFVSLGDMPEYMTCVGFCLNCIKYLLQGEDLFEYQDWDESSLKGVLETEPEYVTDFIKEVREAIPNIKIEDFKKGLRRIWPLEYITGAFSDSIPVRKPFTDDYSPQVNESLLDMQMDMQKN